MISMTPFFFRLPSIFPSMDCNLDCRHNGATLRVLAMSLVNLDDVGGKYKVN